MESLAESLRQGPMSRYQAVVIGLAVTLAALDGFDVLVAAFTAPTLAREMHLAPTQIGMILSAGLAGMGIGALMLAPLADRIGRRPIILLCLAVLFVGMIGAAFSRHSADLIAWRLFTGIGIGGMLANINVIVAEFAPNRWRSVSMSLLTIGYPIGATLGGLASIPLIAHFGWQSVYILGGVVALLLVPVAYLYLPESVDFLIVRRPQNALERLNTLLRRSGRAPVGALPAPIASEASKQGNKLDLFRGDQRTRMVAAAAIYLTASITIYTMVSWTPRLFTMLGFSVQDGLTASTLMNASGVVGAVLYGFVSTRLGERRLAAILMLGLCFGSAAIALLPPDRALLLSCVALIGFCLTSSINALYALVPGVFPASLRATGTGYAMSMGRVGAALGPYLAGLMIGFDWSRATTFGVLALPAALAALCLFWIKPTRQSAAEPTPNLRESAGDPMRKVSARLANSTVGCLVAGGVAVPALLAQVGPAQAIDVSPGAYFVSPAGTNVMMLYAGSGFATSNYPVGRPAITNDTNLTLGNGLFRYFRYEEIANIPVMIQVGIPFGTQSLRLNGRDVGNTSGFADPFIGLSAWAISDPVQKRYLGATAFIFLPLGDYGPARPLNLGANRFAGALQFAYMEAWGPWRLDLIADGMVYGDNPASTASRLGLKQDMTFSLQTWLNYTFESKVTTSLGMTATFGGVSRLNNVLTGRATEGQRIRFGIGYFFRPGTQLYAEVARDISVSGGFKFDTTGFVRLTQFFTN